MAVQVTAAPWAATRNSRRAAVPERGTSQLIPSWTASAPSEGTLVASSRAPVPSRRARQSEPASTQVRCSPSKAASWGAAGLTMWLDTWPVVRDTALMPTGEIGERYIDSPSAARARSPPSWSVVLRPSIRTLAVPPTRGRV